VQRVIVVRPYPARIRRKVFGILRSVGLSIVDADIIAAGTSDDEVMARLAREGPCAALLVPFHAHRDANGDLVNGLEVLRRLPGEAPRLVDTAVFCPISRMGRAAADLMLTRSKESGGLDRAELSKVLFLHEGDLDAPEIGDRVRRHVGAPGAR